MRKLLFFIILFQCTLIGYAQSSADISAYISQYKQVALEQEKKYGIPAPITLAQGILESGAGKSMLTRNANNHLGVNAFGRWVGLIFVSAKWSKN